MGYSHYWKIKKPLSAQKYNEFFLDVAEICEYQANFIANENSTDSSEGEIFINGIGPESHETFVWKNRVVNFNFCKTARKNYDPAVCAILILAKKYYGEDVEISSDGNWSEWMLGRQVLNQVFGIVYDSHLGESIFAKEGQPA